MKNFGWNWVIKMAKKIFRPNEFEIMKFAGTVSTIKMTINYHDTMQIIGTIITKNPDAVDFDISEKSVNSLTHKLSYHKFDEILLLQGEVFLNELLIHFENQENFEACASIIKELDFVNDSLNSTFTLKHRK